MNFPCTCSNSVKTLLAHLSLTTHPQEVKPKLCLHLTKNICSEWLHMRQKATGQRSPSQTQEHQRKATPSNAGTSKKSQTHPFLSFCTPRKKRNFHCSTGINTWSMVSHRHQPEALTKTQTMGISDTWNTGLLAQLKSPGRKFLLFVFNTHIYCIRYGLCI